MKRNPHHATDTAPRAARPCQCPNPVGDPREGTCLYCGHRVPGYGIPSVLIPWVLGDHSTTARKRRLGGGVAL